MARLKSARLQNSLEPPGKVREKRRSPQVDPVALELRRIEIPFRIDEAHFPADQEIVANRGSDSAEIDRRDLGAVGLELIAEDLERNGIEELAALAVVPAQRGDADARVRLNRRAPSGRHESHDAGDPNNPQLEVGVDLAPIEVLKALVDDRHGLLVVADAAADLDEAPDP